MILCIFQVPFDDFLFFSKASFYAHLFPPHPFLYEEHFAVSTSVFLAVIDNSKEMIFCFTVFIGFVFSLLGDHVEMTYTDLKLFDSFLFLVKQANVDTVAPFIH
jgi:hypothetical protein